MKIILASASPRRRQLLSEVCSDFTVLVEETDESLPDGTHPKDGVRILAEKKGEAVYSKHKNELSDALIISSDTLVELDGAPLGKPRSAEEAYLMLRGLSGKRHNVHTGIALRIGEKKVSATATTGVYFRELTDEEIYEYIATGEVWDKAGSYAIQGGAGKFVSKTEGDFDTVVGFSVSLLKDLAAKLGFEELFLK